jgi:hypothetical protein
VIERISGVGLDEFLRKRVFEPLGMRNTGFRPADSLRSRVAPTEVTPPRGYPLRGEVHDENAFVLGGVAGHAGLFGTAGDLAVFAQMILNGGEYNGVRIASDSTVRLFTARAAGTRALGWEMDVSEHGAGALLSDEAFGHTGYTGTSLWIDPKRELFVILLTNRVHAARARRPSRVISDVRADLADAAALAVIEEPFTVEVMPASFRADRAAGWNRPLRSRVRRPPASPRTAVRPPAKAAAPAKATATKSPSKSSTAGPAALEAPAAKGTAPKTTGSASSPAKAPAAKTPAKSPRQTPARSGTKSG